MSTPAGNKGPRDEASRNETLSFEPPATASRVERPPSPSRMGAGTWSTLVVAGLFLASAFLIDVPRDKLLGAPAKLVTLLSSFWPPDVAYGRHQVVRAMLDSIAIAWLGTLIGAVCSLPLGLLAARNLFPRLGVGIKGFFAAVRTFPEILLAVIFGAVVGLGPMPGVLAIGLHSIGMLGKLTADIVESMDLRPVEAVRAAGGDGTSVLRFAVLPQVLPEIVALWLFRFEINLRASAVLGVVGAGGIGGLMLDTLRYRQFDKAGAVVVVTVLVVLVVDSVSGAIRERLTRE